PIIHFCNDFFEQPWDCDTPASRDVWSKKQDIPLSRRERGEEAPVPELHFHEGSKDLLWEARTLSHRLRELHDQDGISYADMAILLRTMTKIDILLQALQEAGVPVKVVDGRNFYNRQDVRDLINLFSFVADPHQDGPLLGLLRSPYFRVSDSFLTRLCFARAKAERAKQGQEPSDKSGNLISTDLWTVLRENNSLPEDVHVQNIVHRLSELHRQGVTMNLAQFVPYIEHMIHPETVLAGQENGAEKLANYRKFRNLALSFAEEQGGTVSAFAERLVFLRESYEKEAAATAVADDAVTIMTIHKSKGLEFPVVALPFTGYSGTNKNGMGQLVYRPGKGIGLSYTSRSDDKDMTGKTIESGILQQLKTENKMAEQQESRRLLYVALTRAEQCLIVTGGYDKDKNGELAFRNDWARVLYNYGDAQAELKAVDPSKKPLVLFFDERKAAAMDAKIPGTGTQKDKEKKPREKEDSIHVPEQRSLFGADAGRSVSDQKDEQKLAPLPGYRETGLTEFTPSMLQDYEYCQRQFYYKDVEHIVPYFDEEKELSLADEDTLAGMPEVGENSPAGSRVPKSLSPTAIGHVIHRTLELVGIHFRENGTLADDDAWRQAYERSLYEFVDGETLTERKQKAEDCGIPDMLEKYRASSLYRDFAPKQVQEELNFRLPFPSAEHPLFHVTGTIDALGVNETGQWEIVDYKTGVLPDEDDVGEPKPGYAYQLALYWYAAEQLAADLAVGVDGKAPVKVAKAMLHYLRGPRSIGLESEADKDRWLERTLALCQEISSKGGEEDFAPTAQQSACLWCPYRYMCRRKEN
ncbi:MAG: 3'-5' exonuclease, partial [Succiniclasticum sp.]